MTIHRDDQTHPYAEEGEFSAAASTLPVLHYFPVRGRAEPIRLTLAYQQQSWFEPDVRPILAVMRTELDGYTFRQLPRFIDEVHGEIDSVQTTAILRHLARKYNMYGGDSLVANLRVDEIVEGAADLRNLLRVLYVDNKMADDKKARYIATVLSSKEELTQMTDFAGPGIACLEHWLDTQTDSQAGWFVTDNPTIADVMVFDLVDLHLQYFPEIMRAQFPRLVDHHTRFAALPGVKDYLSSTSRHKLAWGVDWKR